VNLDLEKRTLSVIVDIFLSSFSHLLRPTIESRSAAVRLNNIGIKYVSISCQNQASI